jgi:peptidoglycan/LPS O-acetylase OafA/YrhL
MLSFVASLWLTAAAPSWAFFGTPARVWEFALGGLIAVRVADRPAPGDRAGQGTLLQMAGLAAVAVAVATYHRALPYPGTAALLPAAGAVALLVGGRWAPAGPVSRALATAGLRWLGRLSYAWYLWHWPLVSVAAVLDPGIGVPGRLAWSAAALGLAWLTHRVIERPAREGRLAGLPVPHVAALAFAASAGMALTANLALRAGRRRGGARSR